MEHQIRFYTSLSDLWYLQIWFGFGLLKPAYIEKLRFMGPLHFRQRMNRVTQNK